MLSPLHSNLGNHFEVKPQKKKKKIIRLWVSELLIRGKLYPDKYIEFGESKSDVL